MTVGFLRATLPCFVSFVLPWQLTAQIPYALLVSVTITRLATTDYNNIMPKSYTIPTPAITVENSNLTFLGWAM